MTLIGVLLSIGVAVGFGLSGPVWVRVLAGLTTSVSLALSVRLLSRRAGLLRRFARWLTEG